MDPWGEEDKILLSNDPHPQGPPVLGSPCPPPLGIGIMALNARV